MKGVVGWLGFFFSGERSVHIGDGLCDGKDTGGGGGGGGGGGNDRGRVFLRKWTLVGEKGVIFFYICTVCRERDTPNEALHLQ